jgi:uncharacterized GH25 family protein
MRKYFFIAAALLPLAAHAHMTWLLPNATLVSGRETTVSVDAGVSADLFVFERALKLEQLRITGPDGLVLEAEGRSVARHHESFDVKLLKDGTYRISNISRSLMGSYTLNGEAKRLRSSPETLDKDLPAGAVLTGLTEVSNRQQTFVSREEPGKVAFAAEGTGLEFLPLSNVTDLSNGDSSRFRLLLDGKPLAHTAITVLRSGNRYRYKMGELSLKSDANGEFVVNWTEPGMYWLGASAGERGGAGGPPPGAPAGGPGAPAAPGAPGAPGAGGPGAGGPGGPMITGGTREKPLQRASVSATIEVLPK